MDLDGTSSRYRARKMAFACELRQRMTLTEKLLWTKLRARRFKKAKFRRQVAVGPYIADFLSYQYRLIIELDGPIHLFRKEYDAARDDYLREQKFKILRFSNGQMLSDPDAVLSAIEASMHGKTVPLSSAC